MPTLNVLRGYDLINAALITVRYFGGIKLGTGGLVRAYSDAANAVINNSSLLSFELKKNTTIAIDLKNLNRFEHFFKKLILLISQKILRIAKLYYISN